MIIFKNRWSEIILLSKIFQFKDKSKNPVFKFQGNHTKMRAQFRIGNNNFSLSLCRWKSVNFRERNVGTQFPTNRVMASKMPTERLHQCGAILGDHIYLFGGVRKQRKQNSQIEANEKRFSAINLKTERWHNLKMESNPPARDSHKLAVMKQELFMFGGSDDKGYFNDLCAFNTFSNEWRSIEAVADQSPSLRDPMIFTCVKNEFLLLVGGICLSNPADKRYLQDAYVFENNTWSQYTLINYPTGLISAQCVSVGNRVFVYGGVDRISSQHSSILYELIVDTSQKTVNWKPIELGIQVFPKGRMNHSILPINSQHFIVIGGSQLNGNVLRDVWMFDLVSNNWTLIEPSNGPLIGIHSHTSVMFNNKIYLIGGLTKDQEFNSEIIIIQFANQELFRSQICENCVSLMEKKETEHKKYPKEMVMSTGFLYNLALEIKFPFQAIMMIYNAATSFNPTSFRIAVQKTLSSFNYIKIQWDGDTSFNLSSFQQFINHDFHHSQDKETFQNVRELTENIKLGALRLGKTLLFVTSTLSHRYVYLLSAQSRISPHYDQTYIYYCYVENLELQRVETEEGIKQRQFILNVLRTHVPLDAELILETKNKNLVLIFEPKVVMMVGKEYINELESNDFDIKVWKNEKKVEFLEERGYSVRDDIEISLRTWMMLYHLNRQGSRKIGFFINNDDSPVKCQSYIDFLNKLASKGLIYRVPLPTDTGYNITGEIYITTHPKFISNNYGLLIYQDYHLYSRFNTEFGQLFTKHFYKTKYKQAKTNFYELGAINITTKYQHKEIYQVHSFQSPKYYSLLQKIQQKCDQVREAIQNLTGQNQSDINNGEKIVKKVKM